MGLFSKFKKKAQEAASQLGNQIQGQPQQDAPPQQAMGPGGLSQEDLADRVEMSIENSSGYEHYLNQAPHFGPFNPDSLDDFFFHRFELADAQMNDALDAKIVELGISGREEWWHIEASYFRRHFGHLSEDEANQMWLQHAVNARNKQAVNAQQAAAAADPSLTEPFEGITIEVWAQAVVGITNNPNDPNVLAQFGMDRPMYDRVNAEFQARMQRDTSFVIATIYGKAFSGAQGVQGGYGLGNADGSVEQLGEAPCTYEQYVEITGAQAAWGEQGADVVANLNQHFQMTAMDISRLGGYWSTKFQADPKLMIKYADDMERAKQKYMGGGHDDDLDV